MYVTYSSMMHFVVCAFYFHTHMIEANYRFEKSHLVSEFTLKYNTDSNVIINFSQRIFQNQFSANSLQNDLTAFSIGKSECTKFIIELNIKVIFKWNRSIEVDYDASCLHSKIYFFSLLNFN